MEYSTEKEILQPILDHGMEGMSEVLQKLFKLAMKLERENVLKATPYQRTEGRTGYANGSCGRTCIADSTNAKDGVQSRARLYRSTA